MEFCGKLRPITALFTQCFQLARNRPCLRLAGPSLARHTCSAMPFRKKQNKTKHAKPEHTQWFVCCARITRQSHKLICTTPMSFHGYFYFPPPNLLIFVILSLKWSNATQTIVFSADYFHFISTVRAAGETHLCLAAGWQGQHGGLGHGQAALVVVNTMGHVCSLCRWSAPRTVTHSSREEATVWKCGNL